MRFLVDGQMQTSPDLPTTVDFGNNLVNYIEVNPDDVLDEDPDATGKAVTKDGEQSAQTKPTAAEEAESNQQQGARMRHEVQVLNLVNRRGSLGLARRCNGTWENRRVRCEALVTGT